MTILLQCSRDALKAQKGLSTIRLRYPVPGTILARTGARTGLEKNGRISGQAEPDIPYSPINNASDYRANGLALYRVGQKSKPANFCNNFVYCQPIFVIFAHIHYEKFATGGYNVSPAPNMVCVTALSRSRLYPCVCTCLLPLIITNTKKMSILDTTHDKKRHNADNGTLLKCYPWS